MTETAQILVVDDDPTLLQILQRKLSLRGFSVETAISGPRALEILGSSSFDLLITDMIMPEMDGVTLIQKAVELQPDLQCIVLTGHVETENIIQAMRAGAGNYLYKPVKDNELEVAVKNGLEKLRLIRQLKENQLALSLARQRQLKLELRNEMILDSAGEGIVGLNTAGQATFVNPAAARMLGWQPRELLGKNFHEFTHHTRADNTPYPESECLIYAAYKNGEVSTGTDELFWRRDGASFPVKFVSTPIIEEENVIGSVVVFEDISERKRVEGELQRYRDNLEKLVEERTAALKEVNVRLRREALEHKRTAEALAQEKDFNTRVVESSPVFFVAIDPDGRVRMMNRKMLETLGYDKEEVVGADYLETFVPENEQESLAAVFTDLAALKPATGHENHIICKNGRRLLIEWHGQPILDPDGRLDYLIGVGIDITESKWAKQRLNYRIQLEKLVSAISTDFLNLPSESLDAEMAHTLERIGTFTRADRSFVFLLSPDGERIDIINRWRAEGIPETPPDKLRNLDVSAFPWWFARLQRFESIHLARVDNLPGQASNEKAFLRELGIKSMLIVPLVSSKRLIGFYGFDSVSRERSWRKEDITLLKTVGNVLASAIERRKAEEEAERQRRHLIEADKMISLGVLVAGVAHEINNPNNFIMMNAPILRSCWQDILEILDRHAETEGDFPIAGIPYSEMRENIPELFSGIEDGAERIKQIVLSLKDYARQDSSEMNQTVSINEVLKAAMTLLANPLKKCTNHLQVLCAEGLPAITGNFQRIEQVLINIIQNACQALTDPAQGITITSWHDRVANEVIVRVSDEGMGIDERYLKQVLDPFFTTKRDIGGTGLGLSISAGIMQEHGGRLDFSSLHGQGTTVDIIFPAAV